MKTETNTKNATAPKTDPAKIAANAPSNSAKGSKRGDGNTPPTGDAPDMKPKQAIKSIEPKKPSAAPRALGGNAPSRETSLPTRGYTRDDIALRAYYISENRRARGLSGDPHQDWIQAERELDAESRQKKPRKP